MTKLSEVIAQVHTLIDEQMNAHKGSLTPEETAKCRDRHKEIEALLDRIANDHLERG